MTAPPIVVGIDGSDGSRLALEWALEEARLRDADVLAVYGLMLVPVAVPELPPMLDLDALHDSAQAFLEAFVEEPAGRFPEVAVRCVVANGPAAESLVEASRDADLLVVGSRGLGGIRGMLLGSVGNQCVQHATCPVVVVHGVRVPVAA
jgi:nucleotide-binding universal stress UspA family protein